MARPGCTCAGLRPRDGGVTTVVTYYYRTYVRRTCVIEIDENSWRSNFLIEDVQLFLASD